MKIALTTLYDSADITRGSGTWFYMGRELMRQGHGLSRIGPLPWHPPLPTRALKRLARTLGKKHMAYRDPFSGKGIAAAAATALGEVDCDIVLTNDYAIAAFLRVEKPVVLFTDEMFPARYRDNLHPWHAGLLPISALCTQYVLRRALRRAAFVVLASQWAVEQAGRYGVPGLSPKLMRVEPGANLDEPPCAAIAASRSLSRARQKEHLEVLFVGNRDWRLKGADIAINVVKILLDRGVPAKLHLVGAAPPGELEQEVFQIHGVIDKHRAPGELEALYESCDVLLVPSLAEGFGIVFAEAAASGLPSLGFRTMGVETAVRHGESGILLPLGAPAESFADVVMGWLHRPVQYQRLAASARRFYESTVNWPTAVSRFIQALQDRGLARAQ